MPDPEDWTKFVTLNPPNEVKFKFQDETTQSVTDESKMDLDTLKATARIEIINKSKSAILFKVSDINVVLNMCNISHR